MFTRSQQKLIKKLEMGSIPVKSLSKAEAKIEDQLRGMGLVQTTRNADGTYYVGLIHEHVQLHRDTYQAMYFKKYVAEFPLIGKKFRRQTTKPYKHAVCCHIRYDYKDGTSKEFKIASWSTGEPAHALAALDKRVGYDFSRMSEKTQAMSHGGTVTLLALEHCAVKTA